MNRLLNILSSLVCALWCTGCSLIDDDLTNCGKDFSLQYEMRLITNMELEINQVLSAETDESVAAAIRRQLSPVFSDRAHDVDLSFFSATEPEQLQFHRNEVIDANRTSFTFYLSKEDYMHLAAANLDNNTRVNLLSADNSRALRLSQVSGDTIGSHQTGLFTARLPMEVLDSVDQTFDVHLYMANCAVALVIDTIGYSGRFISAYLGGTADAFYLRDSLYAFDRHQLIRADEVNLSAPAAPARTSAASSADYSVCYTAVAFPSSEAADKDGNFWQMKVYVQLPNGKITESVLSVTNPLRAGTLKVIKAKMQDDGSVLPQANTQVSAIVTIDWKKGGEQDIYM